MDWLPPCVVALVILRLAVQLALEAVNMKEARRNAVICPPGVAGVMDAATYAKSVEYTLAKGRFVCREATYDAAALLAALFSGALPWLWARFDGLAPDAAWDGALFIVTAMILFRLLNLPLDWWSRFRLEEEFGFNKSTFGLWAADHAKYTLLGLAIGIPAIWAVLALANRAGPAWWLWAFALMFGFQMLMVVLYPKLILPLFNKLSPLPDGALRASLMAMSQRAGFRAKTIEVMDGSRRSGHSNAFFSGFGRFRRIVLFDTLVEQLSPDEVEAVLAHEIGHYRCGHVPKFMALAAFLQLGAFAAVAWLARVPWFNAAFGLPGGKLAPTFLLAGLMGGLVTFWLSPAVNYISRRNEFEADAFAKDAVASSEPMIGALRKLSQKNLSNLAPHPFYSMMYYSHPTLFERERALQE